jgi:ubiquitin-protein ligase
MIGIHRISRDMRSLSHFRTPYWDAKPRSEDDMFNWDCEITTHENSKFSGDKILLTLSFPGNYPMNPPSIRVISRGINHSCIGTDGSIDLFSGGKEWSPAFSIGGILVSIAAELNAYDEGLIRQTERTELIRNELYNIYFLRSNNTFDISPNNLFR